MKRYALGLVLPLLAGGCVARAAVDVVTLPVRTAGKAIDWSTTSQSEADRNRGREMRKAGQREAREAREARERKRSEKECRKQRRDDCGRFSPP